jgi:hypothetical protein
MININIKNKITQQMLSYQKREGVMKKVSDDYYTHFWLRTGYADVTNNEKKVTIV